MCRNTKTFCLLVYLSTCLHKMVWYRRPLYTKIPYKFYERFTESSDARSKPEFCPS